MPIGLKLSLAVVSTVVSGIAAASAESLTLVERIEAQRAIERVYYAHQEGATLPFEQAVPDQLLEKKVRLYLKQSVALDVLWKTPISTEALRREMERIAQDTRMPERLRELYAALGNDPILIQECLVRPVLADRLARGFFSADRGIHAEARRAAEELHARFARGDLDVAEGRVSREIREYRIADDEPADDFDDSEVPGTEVVSLEEFERLRSGAPAQVGDVDPPAEEQDRFVIRVLLDEGRRWFRLATYTVPKASWDQWWAGVERDFDDGSVRSVAKRREPVSHPTGRETDAWDRAVESVRAGAQGGPAVAELCAPSARWRDELMGNPPRNGAYAFWTGSVMLVFGGQGLVTGGRYDPVTDIWRATSTVNWPFSAVGPAVWTGTHMLVYGRSGSGGKYDPVADTWAPISMQGMPSQGRFSVPAVWTGSRMVVWGGTLDSVTYLNTGAMYDPGTDTWTPMSTTDAPPPAGKSMVWAGSRVFVWGSGSGALYDPNSDAWSPVSTVNAPSGGGSMVWTGSRVVIWGAASGGGRYDPGTNTWSPVSTVLAPTPRGGHVTVWTGSVMIVWGGGSLTTGGMYDPVNDTWTPTSTINTPATRTSALAVWADNRMLVWGGFTSAWLESGGRYDPGTDSWTPMTLGDAPAARIRHSAVWTGNQMIVWGGSPLGSSGGLYDPALDHWSPTSLSNAPVGRERHTAVWTGNQMIVWGGSMGFQMTTATGGRYDPIADTWSPTSPAGAPQQRESHTAVWTGSRMIVWGGASPTALNTGGSYDPMADTWSDLKTQQAPTARLNHSAVWTGSVMIIWGGDGAGPTNTGGLYDPSHNSWDATSTTNAPSPRRFHAAAWTGSAMIIWGGNNGSMALGDGALYDPIGNAWSPTGTVGAPTSIGGQTGVWVNDSLLIWGGGVAGGRYNPVSEVWAVIPTNNLSAPISGSLHSAVAAGDRMIVWGGSNNNGLTRRGGQYEYIPAFPDADQDGAPDSCDCDDTAASVYPGAPQLCDGLNNDCSSPSWPALAGTNEGDDDGDGLSECGADCDDAHGSVYPGAPELCDGLNNDCSEPGWPALPPSEADSDADGTRSCADCDDTDPGIWATPAEVPGFGFLSASMLAWDAPGQPGAAFIVYDTIRSGTPVDFVNGAVCVETDDSFNTDALDPSLPPLGGAFYYLVRAENACPAGQGSVGSGSNNIPRVARDCL